MVTHAVSSVGPSVVKRSGRSEPYVEAKLYASLEAACASVRALEGEAALLAERVTANVAAWLGDKPEVTSRDLRLHAGNSLAVFHPEAAYAYASHDFVL